MQVDEFTEVGIYRNQDTVFGLCTLQQRTLPRIRAQMTRLQYIVPVAADPFRQSTASTTVDKKPHNCFTDTAASVSPAITARA